MKSALDVYDEIRADFSRRLSENPQLVERISGLSPDERGQFKKSVMDRYAAMPEYQVDTGIPDYTAADMFAGFPYGGKPTTKTLKRRLMPLEDEQTYAGLKELSKETPDQNVSRWAVAPEKLSEESRKNILAAAEAEKNSDLIPLLKFDKKYLEQLEFARGLLYKDARTFQKDGTDWRNTWIGELARGFGSMTLNPANAAANAYRRARGGVPFGNPEGLTDDEIMERALDDAFGEMMPYLAGTKDFEDIRENVGWGRKISRGLGEIMGFATAGGNPVSLEGAAFAGGVKAASKLGAEKLPAIAATGAKFGAGGAAAAAANIDVGTAVQPNEDIAGTLAKSMLAEAAGSAAFGAGLHTAIAGLSKAFFNQKNPLFKTVFESDIPAAAQYIRTLNERVANGAEIGAENRAVLETIMQTAKESGVDLDALAEGKIAPQYFAKVVRPWIQKIPYIGKMFPERMEGMRFVENKPLAGAKGEAFDAGAFRAKAAADVAASRPARREGLMLEAQTPGQREAIVASFPRTPDGDLPFHIDGAQTHFGSAKEFSEWLFAADSGARQIYDRFENLPERDTIWRDEWLPAFAVKYGAKIDGMNADGRTFSAARSAANTRKIIDSIPDENVSDKLEAISAAEIEDLSDAHLEFAARHGEEWASEEILRRAQESLNAGLEADDVWSRADAAGEKIPSPQALRESGSDLAAEMDAIYGALPDNIKKKYFSASGGKLDETAQYLGYADENDLLDALAESARKFAEGGAPAAPKTSFAQNAGGGAKKNVRTQWDKLSFDSQVDLYESGKYPSGKFFQFAAPSLSKYGISNPNIVITEGVYKKIKEHGFSPDQIKQIQNAVNSPVGVFTYPPNANVFDLLIAIERKDKKPVVASLEINKSRQGIGEVTDLRTMHPKENWGRIVDWARKGRLRYWDKERGRKLLQDTTPANWERYETELAPYVAKLSQTPPKSQADFSENAGGDEEAVFAQSAEEDWKENAPTEAESREAQRQRAAVKAKWENLGAGLTDGNLYAPNGEESKLTKEQWIDARTPNFKQFFGDWESTAIQDFLRNNSFAEISEDILNSPTINIDDVLAFWSEKYSQNRVPGKKISFVFTPKFVAGDVIVDSQTIRSTIAKGSKERNLYLKNKALACIGEIIENGIPININENWKGRGYTSLILTAPITIEGTRYAVQVVITRKIAEIHRDGTIHRSNKAYVVDAINVGSLGNQHAPSMQFNASGDVKTDFPSSTLHALREIFNVNKKNVSKVVDENGEPLVVFRGTDNVNPDYSHFVEFKHSDPRVKKYRHFFSSNRDVAGSMGSYIYECFLDIKNPLVIDAGGNEFAAIKDHTGGIVKFSDLTDSQKRELCKAFDFTPEELEMSYSPSDKIDLVQAGVIRREERSTNEWADYAQEKGFDGVIIRNVRDGGDYGAMQTPADVFVVFDSTQIKSATGNIGTYSRSNRNIFKDKDGSPKKKERHYQDASDNPLPPDISGARPVRFNPKRLDDSPHSPGYDADAADEAVADFLKNIAKSPLSRSAADVRVLREKLAKTTEKLDPRMLDLPELLSFAQSIANVNFSVVKKFRGDWLGVYWPGSKSIQIRADLFRALGDLQRYDLAVGAAEKTLKDAGYAEGAVAEMTNKQKLDAIAANGLDGKYLAAFQASLRKELREAKKSGTPVAAIGVAAHEIMHAIDDVRADGSRIFDGGGTLGHIVGKVLPSAIRSLNVLGGAELSPAMREHFRREARFAAGKRPKKKEDIKRWNEFVSRYYNERVDEFCRANGVLTTDDAREELLEVVRWWQDTPVVGSYWADNPAELYAEAVSVFLLNNAKFRELAPRCYEAIMANIINRPNFADSWAKFQRRLNDPNAPRDEFERQYREGKSRGANAMLANDAATGATLKKIFWQDAKQVLRSENAPFYDIARAYAEKRGLKFYDATEAYHNWRYSTTAQEAYVQRFASEVLDTLSAGGVKPADFEAYMIYRRIIRERYDLANPFGLTPKTAIKALRSLLDSLSPVQRKALTQAGKNRQNLRKKYVVEIVEQSGIFSEKTVEMLIKNTDYARFGKGASMRLGSDIENAINAAYGDDLGGVINKQFGNLGPIKNVMEATLAKDLQIIAFVQRQLAMRNVVEIMKEASPDWIKPADIRWDKERNMRVPIIRENDHMATLVLLRDGAPDAYYLPKFIARPFLPKPKNAALGVISAANSFTKMMLVQANAGIWLTLHARDLLKSMRVISTYAGIRNMPRELWAYIRNLPKAYAAAASLWKGRATAEALDALERQMVVSRRNYWTGEGADIDEVKRLISEFGINDAREYSTRAERLSKLWGAYTAIGQIFERAAKINMKMYVDERLGSLKLSEAQKQQFVREQGGSPDFNERAIRWLHGLIEFFTGSLFINARKQGFASEITGARQFAENTGKSRKRAYAEWTFHTLLWSSPGAFVKMCARLGLIGVLLRTWGCSEDELPDAEQMYWQIPEYDRLNKICVPLGRDSNGKTIYLRLPYGDFERYYGNLCTSFVEAFELEEEFIDGGVRWIKNIKRIGESELGGGHPITGTATNLAAIALGENPTDGIGRPIIDETAYKAGDMAGIVSDTARYAYNNTIGAILGRAKPPVKAGEPSPAFLEKVLSMPGISAAVGRWIAVSDKGLDQLARDAARKEEKTSAQRTLLRRELAEKAAAGTISDVDFERLEGGFARGDKQALRQQLKKIEARKNGKMDSILINYPARAQQEAIRKQFKRIGASGEGN